MTLNEMLNAVINRFGFEHEHTISFARTIETSTLSIENLKSIFEQVMAKPIFSDEI